MVHWEASLWLWVVVVMEMVVKVGGVRIEGWGSGPEVLLVSYGFEWWFCLMCKYAAFLFSKHVGYRVVDLHTEIQLEVHVHCFQVFILSE